MVDRKTYTPEEYQSSYIDYYGGFGGIDVKKAPPPVDAAPADTVTPDILSPVEDDGGASIFNQMNIATGMPTFSSEDYDYNDYIKNFGETEQEKTKTGKDKSLGGFVDWAKNELRTKPELLVGTATGVPGLGAIMAIGAAMNRKEQLKNANKIAESGGTGGAMFKVNNQFISRAPGSRIYSGTLGGMSQQQVANIEAIRRGFIPGTMVERAISDDADGTPHGGGFNFSGKGYLTSIGGAAMDAYGTVHSASGIQGASASEGTALREKLFVDAMKEAGISLAGINVSSAALEMKQALDANMKGGIGTFETVRRQDGSTYNSNLVTAQGFVTKYVTDKYGSGTTEDDGGTAGAGAGTRPRSVIDSARMAGINAGPATSSRVASSAMVNAALASSAQRTKEEMAEIQARQEQRNLAEAQRKAKREAEKNQFEIAAEAKRRAEQQQEDDGPPPSGPPTEYSMDTGFEDRTDFGGSSGPFAEGGRVGLQMGGTPGAPAGFVERPPSQVSEAATVADDKPMSVPEGTFVINAAAVEIAGEADIAKMLNKAYENYRTRGGKEVMGRTPSKEEVDVAVSRGEVLVPPAIAKIIGYDRLEKINNRGKKETKQRIEENGQGRKGAAGGGFLDAGKYAEGGDVGEDIPFDQSVALDDANRKEFKTFLSSKRQRGDVEKLIDNMDDRGRLFLLGLVETTASKDSLESMTGVMQTAINRANTDRPSFKKVNDLASVMKQRSSRGSGSRMFQYDGLEPKKITPRLQEVMQGRVPNAVTKLFTAAENLMNPETEGQRPLPFDVMFYTKPDAPLAKDFENNPMMRYFTSFGGHDYYALDAAPEGTRK